MSLAVLRSRALAGMEAPVVSVEVHLANGLPGLTIAGTTTPNLTAVRNSP
jgi:magnesium chelatase family protein